MASDWNLESTRLLEPLVPTSDKTRDRLHRLGLLALLALVCVSVLQAEAAQALQTTSHFSKPFFITCFDHAITIFLLPAVYLFHRVRDGASRSTSFINVLQRHSVHPLKKLAVLAVVLNTVYLAADYLWFSALRLASVAVSTAVSNTAPCFVYLFSVCFLRESVRWQKLSAVAIALAGVTLITFSQDEDSPADPNAVQTTGVLACGLVVLQTMLVAAYGVAFRVFAGDDVEDASTVLTLTGFCGIATLPVWAVGSVVLSSLRPDSPMYEPLGWPDSSWGLFLLVVAGSLAGAYTVLQSLALCWTSPLVTSVGAMLTIPLSLLWDMTLNHRVFPWVCLLGVVLVMAGFVALERASQESVEASHTPKIDVEASRLVSQPAASQA